MGVELEASEVWTVQGQRRTCVTNCHPPPNLGRNLFPLRLKSGEVFFPHPIQRRSMAQRVNRLIEWVLGMHHPAAGLRAAVRCSQVPHWGQTK
jgi:hypothetical protein